MVDTIDMDDTKVTRPPVWVFGVLFLAYLGAHVGLLLFIYSVAPSTSSLGGRDGRHRRRRGGRGHLPAGLPAHDPARSTLGAGTARAGMIRGCPSTLRTTTVTVASSPSRSGATSRR